MPFFISSNNVDPLDRLLGYFHKPYEVYHIWGMLKRRWKHDVQEPPEMGIYCLPSFKN